MKHLILGTAGHIDHGKTSLVKFLTGIDTDRLKEEKARGITIELGFAHLELPEGICFGIVDVPGHEKFVRTMVAGVGGMDLVMLVIAADEGIMPQTREHLDILRLLGVKSGLVALTKRDMVDQEWLELVTEEVRDFVAGSFLEGAPIVPVSSRTGEGFDDLKRELARLALAVDEKRREGLFRLPVDRVFTVAGFGTVVTGTLLSGEISVGDDVELLPSGRQGRVRGIQAHGARAEKGQAGQRLAVNLQGVDLDEVQRGDVVVPRDAYRVTRRVDVRLDHLASAPRELKHRATVRFHSATYEAPAQVILLDRETVPPGTVSYVQLRLREPVLLLSGDSYILRTLSPPCTIGGGRVLDPFPPRHRRRSVEAIQLLESLDTGEHQCTIRLLVSQSLLSGIPFGDLSIRSGIPRKSVDASLAAILTSGDIIQMTRDPRTFISRSAFNSLTATLLRELEQFHGQHPLKEGMGREELKTRLPRRTDQRFFTPLLNDLIKSGAVVADKELVRLSGFLAGKSALAGQDEIIELLIAGGTEPPTARELQEKLQCGEKELRDSLALLIRNGKAVRVSADLCYAAGPLSELRDKLVACITEKGEITPAEYREATGLSRKFLIPLLEQFDSEKLTIRVGEKRLLRKGRS